MEANVVFPTDAKSAYISSYFDDSFDFPYNPDPLAASNDYSIYDEMRHDDQIKAVVGIKKDMVLAPGWEIRCEKKEIVEAVENNLKHGLDSSFEDSVRDILSSFEYGFSLTEVLYRKPKTGKVELKDLRTRPPQTFEFNIDSKGTILSVTQNTETGQIKFKPSYFLHFIYQPEFGNPYGQSDLRAAHQAWKTKKFFLRFWAMYVERFAQPTVVGTYPETFEDSKITDFFNSLNTVQNATTLVVPEGTTIDFKSPGQDSSGIYEKGISLLNTMMARAILMPDLLGMSGEKTKGGSYSLGQTQFGMFMASIQKEQEALARKMTMKVIRPMVLANWGNIPCEFAFKPFTQDDTGEFMKLWIEATKNKIWNPAKEEIDHIRELLKFPVVDVETPRPDATNEPPKQPQPDKAPMPEGADFSQVVTFREKTKFERTINLAEIKKTLDVSEQRVTPRLKSTAKTIYEDFIDQIKNKNIIGKFKPDKINDLKPRYQRDMNQEFKRFMKKIYTESYDMAQKEIFPKAEKKFVEAEELLPEEFLSLVDAEAFKLVGDYSVNITNKMKNILTQGIKNGIGEKALIKQLRELGAGETDKWLKTVVRTKSTEMFNRARKSYYDNDELASQVVEAFQFSAILDDRTSEVCEFLDGKIFTKGELTKQITPPLHFSCRSLLVPVTKFEDYKREKKYVPPNKEPSVDSLKDKGGNLIV